MLKKLGSNFENDACMGIPKTLHSPPQNQTAKETEQSWTLTEKEQVKDLGRQIKVSMKAWNCVWSDETDP